eukprot:6188576-Prymnesium_polylepis.2
MTAAAAAPLVGRGAAGIDEKVEPLVAAELGPVHVKPAVRAVPRAKQRHLARRAQQREAESQRGEAVRVLHVLFLHDHRQVLLKLRLPQKRRLLHHPLLQPPPPRSHAWLERRPNVDADHHDRGRLDCEEPRAEHDDVVAYVERHARECSGQLEREKGLDQPRPLGEDRREGGVGDIADQQWRRRHAQQQEQHLPDVEPPLSVEHPNLGRLEADLAAVHVSVARHRPQVCDEERGARKQLPRGQLNRLAVPDLEQTRLGVADLVSHAPELRREWCVEHVQVQQKRPSLPVAKHPVGRLWCRHLHADEDEEHFAKADAEDEDGEETVTHRLHSLVTPRADHRTQQHQQ